MGQVPADGNAVGGTTTSTNIRPTRVRKPTAKVKDALTRGGARVLKTKRTVVTSDNEGDQAQPPKKKRSQTNVVAESDADADEVSLVEELPKTTRIRVFSRVSEDSQNTRSNKGPNSDDSDKTSTGENNVSDAAGGASDAAGGTSDAAGGASDATEGTSDAKGGASDEEWEYSQLDEMATKDAKVSGLSP
jgi:hypothetical protein